MKFRTLRSRIAAGATITMAVLAGTLAVSSGVASANPSDPTLGSAPQYYSGNNSQIVRSAGSDTTFYINQQFANLYNESALYGCAVAKTADFPCPVNDNSATSDTADNWDRNEVLVGIDDVGSGDGQKQLCQTEASPDAVDYARSSKPNLSYCPEEDGQGFAYDGVPEVDFTTINPSAFGPVEATFTTGPDSGDATPWYAAADSAANLAANGNQALVGPVADGWIPGDPAGGPYSGTAFTNITNNNNGGGSKSEAYKLYCVAGASNGQITDWGEITNIGPDLVVVDAVTTSGSDQVTIASGAPEGTTFPSAIANGDEVTGTNIPDGTTVSSGGGTTTLTLSNDASASDSSAPGNLTVDIGAGNVLSPGSGVAVGMPMVIAGVNSSSGTDFTIAKDLMASGTNGTECDTGSGSSESADTDLNAEEIDNTSKPQALENDAANLPSYAQTIFPSDAADQATMLASELYYMSEGVLLSNAYARQVSICANGEVPQGGSTPCPSSTLYSYGVTKMKENGVAAGSITEGDEALPTSRVLYQLFLGYQAAAKNSSGYGSQTVTDASFSSSSNVVTLGTDDAEYYQSSAIGRDVTGTNIPANDYIIGTPGMIMAGNGEATSSETTVPANSIELALAPTGSGTSVTFTGATVGLRASTLGLLNWICSTNGDGVLNKGLDNQTGLNYDSELTTLVDTTYGFNRITDIQTGDYAGDCPLIYPTWTNAGAPGDGGSALSDPYPGGVAAFGLPDITSGTYDNQTGAIPFPNT